MDTTNLKLLKPIQAHGETCTELNFREPTGKDISACGYPFRMAGKYDEVQRTTDTTAVARYIVVLCGIPQSSVDQLCIDDFQEAMLIVLGFFQRTRQAASS